MALEPPASPSVANPADHLGLVHHIVRMYELEIEPDLKARPTADSRPTMRIADYR